MSLDLPVALLAASFHGLDSAKRERLTDVHKQQALTVTHTGLLGQPDERKTVLIVALRLALSDATERLQRRRPQHQRVRTLTLEPLEHVLRTKHQRGGSVWSQQQQPRA